MRYARVVQPREVGIQSNDHAAGLRCMAELNRVARPCQAGFEAHVTSIERRLSPAATASGMCSSK